MSKELVPQQQEGAQSNTEETVALQSRGEAKDFFEKAKQRLLNVNSWHQYAGTLSAHFKLTDERGDEAEGDVKEGDHFKIDIPGPGPVTGDGYDWVQVEKIENKKGDDEESLTIRVRPATNPKNERKDTAHFFSEEATSCFVIKREGKQVTAGVYGRNEKPNTAAETAIDKTRNAAVATGAVTAFSKLQWKSLVKGLIGDK